MMLSTMFGSPFKAHTSPRLAFSLSVCAQVPTDFVLHLSIFKEKYDLERGSVASAMTLIRGFFVP